MHAHITQSRNRRPRLAALQLTVAQLAIPPAWLSPAVAVTSEPGGHPSRHAAPGRQHHPTRVAA